MLNFKFFTLKNFLLIIFIVASFLFGIIVAHFKLPPLETIAGIYRLTLKDTVKKLNEEKVKISNVGSKNFDGLEQIKNDANKTLGITSRQMSSIRERIAHRVILPSHMVKTTEKVNIFGRVEISTNLYGIQVRSFLTKSNKSNSSCLKIYIQGHGGDPFLFNYHNQLLNHYTANGCDFFSMSMLGIGSNAGKSSFPGSQYLSGQIELSAKKSLDHSKYRWYSDPKFPQKDPLALFLTPHYYQIQRLLDRYDTVGLIGFSGGGWYAVWLAALMDGIDHTISYSGSLPFIFEENPYDWEQSQSSVYNDINYWELYWLAGHSLAPAKKKRLHLIYHDRDPCCYRDPKVSKFAFIANQIYPDNIRVMVARGDTHAINQKLVKSILDSTLIKF